MSDELSKKRYRGCEDEECYVVEDPMEIMKILHEPPKEKRPRRDNDEVRNSQSEEPPKKVFNSDDSVTIHLSPRPSVHVKSPAKALGALKTPEKPQQKPQETPVRPPPKPQETLVRQPQKPQETPVRQPQPQGTPVRPPPKPQGTPVKPPQKPQETPVRQQQKPQETPVKPPPKPQGTPVKPPPKPQETPVQQTPKTQAAPEKPQQKSQEAPATPVNPVQPEPSKDVVPDSQGSQETPETPVIPVRAEVPMDVVPDSQPSQGTQEPPVRTHTLREADLISKYKEGKISDIALKMSSNVDHRPKHFKQDGRVVFKTGACGDWHDLFPADTLFSHLNIGKCNVQSLVEKSKDVWTLLTRYRIQECDYYKLHTDLNHWVVMLGLFYFFKINKKVCRATIWKLAGDGTLQLLETECKGAKEPELKNNPDRDFNFLAIKLDTEQKWLLVKLMIEPASAC